MTKLFLCSSSNFYIFNTKWDQLTASVTTAMHIIFIDLVVSVSVLSAEKGWKMGSEFARPNFIMSNTWYNQGGKSDIVTKGRMRAGERKKRDKGEM